MSKFSQQLTVDSKQEMQHAFSGYCLLPTAYFTYAI